MQIPIEHFGAIETIELIRVLSMRQNASASVGAGATSDLTP